VPKGIRESGTLRTPKGAQGNQGIRNSKDKVQAIFTDVRMAFTLRNRIQFFKKGNIWMIKVF
jgi:hypothetical protein